MRRTSITSRLPLVRRVAVRGAQAQHDRLGQDQIGGLLFISPDGNPGRNKNALDDAAIKVRGRGAGGGGRRGGGGEARSCAGEG